MEVYGSTIRNIWTFDIFILKYVLRKCVKQYINHFSVKKTIKIRLSVIICEIDFLGQSLENIGWIKLVARHWANIKNVNLVTMDQRYANVLVRCCGDEQNYIGPVLFSDIWPT